MKKAAKNLRAKIIRALKKQGFGFRHGEMRITTLNSKEDLRRLHAMAIKHKLAIAQPYLMRHEDTLLSNIADGIEVKPAEVSPCLIQVRPDTREELLFRYAALHWSIPVSSGYGRRLRFLVLDRNNGKLIGLFGLGDPVYAVSARDTIIGWSAEARRQNLYHIMDAYVLGAVPPYSELLCGKLIAMLALSNEVRQAFEERYSCNRSLISRKRRPPYLALITTTSAFGRSSLYNRLRIGEIEYWTPAGFTRGSGDFHFSNGLYATLRSFVEKECRPTAKQGRWGTGFRNKREVIRKCLAAVGLPEDLIYHGVNREVYIAPTASNSFDFLRGETKIPIFYDRPASALVSEFRNRWLLRRAESHPGFQSFTKEQYRLWPPASSPTEKARD